MLNETNTTDNTNVIVIHTYVMSNSRCQSLIIVLSKMENDGATFDYLTKVIIHAFIVNVLQSRPCCHNIEAIVL